MRFARWVEAMNVHASLFEMLWFDSPHYSGKAGDHLGMKLDTHDGLIDTVWWRGAEHLEHLAEGVRVDVVGNPVIDTWRIRVRARLGHQRRGSIVRAKSFTRRPIRRSTLQQGPSP